MCKKVTFGVLGLLLVGGLLFGGKVIPYVQTAYNKVKTTAEDSVPISFQIEAAKNQLDRIGPEIHGMIHQIAKEKIQVKKLAAQLDQHNNDLKVQYDKMMTLRSHMSTGDKFYVATNGKAYTNDRVEEDLRHRFTVYQTAEQTRDKLTKILEIRQSSLESALAKVEEAKAQQRELEIQIENLSARQSMNEVVVTASKFNVDNSQLSKTREMVEDIDARIAAEEEMLNLIPKYTTGQIPVGEDYAGDTDILDEMDAYFQKKSDVEDDDLVGSDF